MSELIDIVRAEYYEGRTIRSIHCNFNGSSLITTSNEVFVWGKVSHTDIGNLKFP